MKIESYKVPPKPKKEKEMVKIQGKVGKEMVKKGSKKVDVTAIPKVVIPPRVIALAKKRGKTVKVVEGFGYKDGAGVIDKRGFKVKKVKVQSDEEQRQAQNMAHEENVRAAIFEYFEDSKDFFEVMEYPGGMTVMKRKLIKMVLENNNSPFMPYEAKVDDVIFSTVIVEYSRRAIRGVFIERMVRLKMKHVVIDSTYEVKEKLDAI